jgi:predicted small metal-binding protein
MNEDRWEVEARQDKRSGACSVGCPMCAHVASALTSDGVMAAVVDHMNEFHYRPPRGNA